MADTIAGGEEERSPRRRSLVRVLWFAALVGVALALLVPVLQRHRAAADAAWLQRQWATTKALEDTRQAVVKEAYTRAGIGDLPRYLRIVAAAELEEADRLAVVRDKVRRRHSGGVTGRAETAVGRAVSALVDDLRAAAPAPVVDDQEGLVLEPVTAGTAGLLATAGDAVQAAARAHHLGAAKRPHVQLTSPREDLAVLQRVTDRPVGLRFLVATGTGATLWDLGSGRARDLPLDAPPSDLALAPVADNVFVSGGGTFQLLPLDGRPARRVPPADVYLPAGGDGMWRALRGRVRRYDAAMRPRGAWAPLPDPRAYLSTATTDAVALQAQVDNGSFRTMLWWPSTGRTLWLPEACAADIVAARTAFAYSNCAHTRIVVHDAAGSRRAVLRPPPGYRFDAGPGVLSADGRHLATSVIVADVTDTLDRTQRQVAVFDVRSGKGAVLPNSLGLSPQGWSGDGRVLLVAATSRQDGTAKFPLAFWTVGDEVLHAIRADGTYGFATVAALP